MVPPAVIGLITSLSSRNLIATATGSHSTQVVIFSFLDITISAVASLVFIQNSKVYWELDASPPFLKGRAVGFIAAAAITAVTTGMVDLPNLMLVSGVSQALAFAVWRSLPFYSLLFLG